MYNHGMYRFILGAGGTGKSTYLYERLTREAIQNPHRRYFLFVPEQNTLKAQQALIHASERHGMLNLDVLSFQLLAYRVMEELGVQKPDVLDEMSRSLFLRRACQEVRKDLKACRSSLDKQGFIAQLKSLLSEFSQYQVGDDTLQKAEAAAQSPLLKDKLSDVRLIFRAFHELLGGKAAAPEEIPVILLKLIGRSQILKDAVIAFDGYTGYTPIQLALIEQIMRQAAETFFTVTIPESADPFCRDGSAYAIADLWWLSKETIAKICQRANRNGIPAGETIYLDRRPAEPVLSVLEAEDPTDEIRRIASEIRELTMQRGASGLRFRDIAVAVSDPGDYQEVIRREFEKASIPFFLDDKSDSTESAAVELVRAALSVLSHGWRYDDVIRYLRNPLLVRIPGTLLREGSKAGVFPETLPEAVSDTLPEMLPETESEEISETLPEMLSETVSGAADIVSDESLEPNQDSYVPDGLDGSETGSDMPDSDLYSVREVVDLIDNYVRARGLHSRRAYEAEWTGGYRGAEELNLVPLNAWKERLLAPLFALQDALKEDKRVAARVEAVRAFLLSSDANARTKALAQQLKESGMVRMAEENERFLLLTETLLERLSALMGADEMSLPEFSQLIDAGFADLKAGMIPQTMDMLVIGDLKRSRFDGIGALYIIGANEGAIPSAASGGGLFTEEERAEMQKMEVELAPSDKEGGCIQNFYLYLLMHKPVKRLTVSYVKNGRDGKPKKPSELIGRLRSSRKQSEEAEEAGFFSAEKPGFFSADEMRYPVSESDALQLFAAWARESAREGEREEEREGTEEPEGTREGERAGTGEGAREGAEAGEEAREGAGEGKQDGRAERKRFLTLYNYLRRNPNTAALSGQILEAAFFRHGRDRLSARTAGELYGDVLYGSVTRIESFERCPYAHFLKYGLGLRERQQFDLEAADIGTLYHNALDLVFRSLEAQGVELWDAPRALLSELTEQAVQTVTTEYNGQVMQSSAKNRYLAEKVRLITERTLWALSEQAKKGSFHVYGCEIPFRLKTDGLDLHGRIDRMDVADVPEEAESRTKVAVKIIDYKSGRTQFDLSAVYQGMQLQLVTYMDLALTRAEAMGRQAVPAGMFYYHIDDPVIDYADLPEAKSGSIPDSAHVSHELLASLKMSGLVNADPQIISLLDKTLTEDGKDSSVSDIIPVKLKGGVPEERYSQTADERKWRALQAHVSARIRQDANRMAAGDIDRKPFRDTKQHSGCEYCPYHAVCGFDSRLRGFSYRHVRSFSKDEVWERLLCEQDEEQDSWN